MICGTAKIRNGTSGTETFFITNDSRKRMETGGEVLTRGGIVSSDKLETAFNNHELTVGYPMNALGLFAVDPEEGEILYAVTKELSGNCYMPPYNGITVSGAYITLVTAVGNADNVSLEVPPGAIATIANIKDLQKQINEISNHITTHNVDPKAHLNIQNANFEVMSYGG